MSEEKTRKLAEEALNRLATELEAGKSEGLKSYLAAMGRFHQYSWNNVALIHSQRPDATRVAGFHTWHDLGRFVKKGEKGIAILAPMVVKARSQDVQTPGEVQETRHVAGFRTAYVFDVKQTDGRDMPRFATVQGDPKDFNEKLKQVIADHGIAVAYDPAIAPAQGVSSGGHIRLLPDMKPPEEFSVLVHELAHEMLHHRPEAASLPKTVRETQAEAVAHVVASGVGLDTNHAAADYITLYNGDKKTLAESLATIQATASRILDQLLPKEHDRHERPGTEREESTSLDQTPESPAHTEIQKPISLDR